MEKKEAMKILKDFHDKSALFSIRTALDTIIPELKESEGEDKIMKELIYNIIVSNDYTPSSKEIFSVYGKTKEDAIAWLEKQGGQKEYTFKSLPRLLDMIEPTSRAKAYCQKLINALVKEGYSTDAKIVGECLKKMNGEDVPMAIMDEKQGEPIEVNPTEFDLRLNRLLKQFESLSKEELASSLSFYLNVVQNDGTYKDSEKQCGQKPFDYENTNIQQKDFASKVEQKPDLEKGKWYVCDTSRYTDFVVGKAYLCPKNGMLKPNENEMARYVARNCFHIWTIQDAKDGDVLHSTGFHNDCIFIFNGLDNWRFDEPNGDRAVATGYCCLSVSADNMEFGVQGPDCIEVNTVKPATNIQRDLLFQMMKESGYKWDTNKLELKRIDIQELVKQNPVWGEDDERKFSDILALLRGGENCHYNTPDLFDWLKSLKARHTWKPSDEQMAALSDINLTGSISYAGQGQELINLYNDLKNLKE